MKNSIKRSHLSILVIVLLLMTGITLGELSLFIFKPYAVVAESINNIINMNDDSFYYNGNRYALNSYDSLIGNTQEIVQDELTNKLVVTGDDAITSLIPKEKFLNVGSSLAFGKEWGYYINTINDYNNPSGDSNHSSLNKRSYVTIFDLTYAFDSNNGEISVGVSPLYQYEYVALSPKENIVVGYTDDGFSESSYTGWIKYELPSLETPIVISSHTDPRRRYYLKDISYSMTLWNEQAPNQINGGMVYNTQQDNGAYFTYMDYEYNGVVRENKEFPGESAITLAKSTFDFIVGSVTPVSAVGTAFKLANTLIKDVDKADKIISAGTDVFDYIQNPISFDSVEKHITSQNYNANRDEQIRNYGGLLKNMELIVNTPESKSIWFGAGNSSSCTFKITDTAINGTPHNYTRVNREIGLKIVDAATNSVVDTECMSDIFNIYSPVYDRINLEEKNDIYILPKGKNYFEFTPDYSGYYDIDLSNSILNCELIDANEKIIFEKSNIYLEKNKTYKIVISSNEFGCQDSFSIKIASAHLLGTLESNDERIVKISVDKSEIYSLSTESKNVYIKNIFTANMTGLRQYVAFSKYVPRPSLFVPFEIDDYYIVLQNRGNTKLSFDLQISECETGVVGYNNAIDFDGCNYAFMKLINLDSGNYTISLKNSNSVQYEIYDSKLNKLTTTLFGNGFCSISVQDNIIYIGAKIDKEIIDYIVVNKNKNAYLWKIDDNVVSDNTIELERGKDYNIQFLINNKNVGTDFISDNPQSKYSYTLLDGTLSIKDYCKTDAGYFTLKYSFTDETSYNSELYVIPKYTQKFTGIQSVTNDEMLAFYWKKTSDLYEIKYSLKRGNETRQYTISTLSQSVDSLNCESIKEKINAFTVKIGYVEICIYQIKIKTSQTIEEYQFNSSTKVDGTYGGGLGTASNPYLISCNRHFNNLEFNKDNTVHFRAINTIVISSPIEYFYGIFGGNQYPHASVVINYSGHYNRLDSYEEIGMFRYNYGTIYNIQAQLNINITGGVNSSGAHIAAIAAYNHGSIINCRSINFTVYTRCSKGYVGGIVAENYGLVENCWAYNEVTTSGKFGGITAENHDNGIIKNCSVFGTVNLYIDNINNEYTITYAGGIAGINSGEISNCKIGGMDDQYLKFIVHVDYVNDKNLKPYIGTACGYNKGKITDCQRISFILDTGNLHSFKEWFKTYNQQSNINNDLG